MLGLSRAAFIAERIKISYSRYLVVVGESLEKESFFVNIRMRCIVHHFCYTKVTPQKKPTTRVGRRRKMLGGRGR